MLSSGKPSNIMQLTDFSGTRDSYPSPPPQRQHPGGAFKVGPLFHGIVWLCMVLHGILWFCMVLRSTALFCIVLDGFGWNCMVLNGGLEWYCMLMHGLDGLAWYCMVLLDIAV